MNIVCPEVSCVGIYIKEIIEDLYKDLEEARVFIMAFRTIVKTGN